MTRVRISAGELAAKLGVHPNTISRRIQRGELPVLHRPRQGRALELDPRVLERLDDSRPVRVPGHVWRALLELLPAVSPASLAHEVAGALRAAASGAGVGRRKVELAELDQRGEIREIRSPQSTKAARRR